MSLTTEQTTARKRRIGSTEIAAIVALYRPELAHLAKKKNATDIWLRLVHGIDQPRRAVMTRGTRVEPILRELYRETIGAVADPPGTLAHPVHEWACASPDGVTPGFVQEFKTCSEWIRDQWGEPGSDRVPDDYGMQIQWLLEVVGRPFAHVLVAFGRDFKEDDGQPGFAITDTAAYVVNRDERLAASMVELGQRFWSEHVIPRVPPALAPLHNKRKFKQLEKERNGQTSDSGRDDGFSAEYCREQTEAIGWTPGD